MTWVARCVRGCEAGVGQRGVQLASLSVAALAVFLGVVLWPVDEVRATGGVAPCPVKSHFTVEGEHIDHAPAPVGQPGVASNEETVRVAHFVASRPAIAGHRDGERLLEVSRREATRPAGAVATVDAVRKVLVQLDADHLDSELDERGVLQVSGYMPSRADWQEIASLLRRDFPSVSTIDDAGVEYLESRVAALNNEIAKVQLEHELSVVGANGAVLVDGALGAQQAQRWQRVRNAFVASYGNSTELVENVTTEPPAAAPDVEIAGTLVSRKKQYMVLADGRVYRVGESMPGGVLVKRIGVKHVTLVVDDTEFVLAVSARG